MKERTQLILKLVLSHLILLPVLISIPAIINYHSVLFLSVAQGVLIILFFSGYWEFFGIRFKFIYCLLAESAIIFLLAYECSKTPSGYNLYIVVPLLLIQLILLIQIIRIIIVILRRENESMEIVFPFKNGKYLVTDGGNSKLSRLMNYHFYSSVHKKNNTNNSMLFATDIVKLNDNNSNFLPPRNEDYPVFGEKVLSPVSGTVFKVVNDIDDNIPYSGHYPYNTGNTIVIQNGNRYMLLGHLKKGSIHLETGQIVNAGDVIAEAGNSGYSERPHIHMQLIKSSSDNYWNGMGLSIHFKNRNLYKNRMINI